MKDRPDRAARLHLIESMFAGQSWQTAAAQSQLKISRSTAYRLVQFARDEEKAARVLSGIWYSGSPAERVLSSKRSYNLCS